MFKVIGTSANLGKMYRQKESGRKRRKEETEKGEGARKKEGEKRRGNGRERDDLPALGFPTKATTNMFPVSRLVFFVVETSWPVVSSCFFSYVGFRLGIGPPTPPVSE